MFNHNRYAVEVGTALDNFDDIMGKREVLNVEYVH